MKLKGGGIILFEAEKKRGSIDVLKKMILTVGNREIGDRGGGGVFKRHRTTISQKKKGLKEE